MKPDTKGGGVLTRFLRALSTMRSTLLIVQACQRTALRMSYWAHRLTTGRSRRDSISWVVGPDDVASMVVQIASAISNSYSVSFSQNPSYAYAYDHRCHTRDSSPLRWIERIFVGPILLGRLMNRARGFLYVGDTGFLLHGKDQRAFEFAYLKKHSRMVVCYWCGSDIRSTRRMHELEAATDLPNISTYIRFQNPRLETDGWERIKAKIAAVADRYADAMFSNSVDHLSYLTRPTEPFLYFFSDEDIVERDKFNDLSCPVIVHASSSPIIKGTPLVRAAIALLRSQGYEFEYVELIGVSNAEVKRQLARAHISLNQFYGFSPAVFGAESLAAGCAVMMSADPAIETDLPPESSEAWLVTKHHQVYENLRLLLDEPHRIEPLARRGQAWAREYASQTGAGEKLNRVLNAVLDGTYEPFTGHHG